MRNAMLGLAIGAAAMFGATAQAATPTTFTVGPATPCAVVCAYWDAPTALGYEPCEHPFPEGSYADITVTAPPGSNILKLEIFPDVDWDSFICAANNGRLLARGVNLLSDNCNNIFGPNNPFPIGCYEKAVTPATPGTEYLLRFYNWSDPSVLPGQYTFLHI